MPTSYWRRPPGRPRPRSRSCWRSASRARRRWRWFRPSRLHHANLRRRKLGHTSRCLARHVPANLPRGKLARGAKLAPVAPERFLLQLTIGRSTQDKLRYAQQLLGHALPSGDLAQVLDRALDALIERLEKRKCARARRPRPSKRSSNNPRHIPAHVKRAVWERDQGRCTFVSKAGRRCPARTRLEFDHVDEVARGGRASVAGIRLRCRAHNQYGAECTFGAEFMREKREAAGRKAETRRQEMAARAADEERRNAVQT